MVPKVGKAETQKGPFPGSVALAGGHRMQSLMSPPTHDSSPRAQLRTFQRFISWPGVLAVEVLEIIKADSVRSQVFTYRRSCRR